MTDKFTIATELHFRQQANYKNNSKNIFEEPNVRAVKLWLNYQLKNNFAITVNPITYFITDEIENAKGLLIDNDELRLAIGVTKDFKINKCKQKNRLLFETRFINYDANNNSTQRRYRLFNSVAFPIKKINSKCNLYYQLANEFFIKTQQSTTSFDQNRLQNLLQLQLPKIDFNIGYQYTVQGVNDVLINKNQFLFSTNFNL
ncbi:MAG: DUF2490 domain-containing protein [Bacteroidetes bacterium]|nr:DUF2490 domain-containing protein [Bacteroidota bacterium]